MYQLDRAFAKTSSLVTDEPAIRLLNLEGEAADRVRARFHRERARQLSILTVDASGTMGDAGTRHSERTHGLTVGPTVRCSIFREVRPVRAERNSS